MEISARESRYEIADPDYPGLWIRVNSNGTKTCALSTKVTGKKVKITLGTVPALSVKAARQKADQAKIDLKSGVDINAAKRETVAAGTATIEDVIEDYAQLKLKSMRSGVTSSTCARGSGPISITPSRRSIVP